MNRVVRLGQTVIFSLLIGSCTPAVVVAEPMLVPTVASVAPAVSSAAVDAGSVPCEPQIAALRAADNERWPAALQSVRDACGGAGLIAAVSKVEGADEATVFSRTKRIFEMIDTLGDPRAADGLAEHLTRKSSHHWRMVAATSLGRLGDVRAVPTLAEVLKYDPQQLYDPSKVPEERALGRSDTGRVVAVRTLAELAELHPDRRPWILEQAESAVIRWMTEGPVAHANGMRFLATAGSSKGLVLLRKWAFPGAPLPKQGQQPPFPVEWELAQLALRYLGRMHDAPSWPAMEKQLARRKTEAGNIDVSMNALMGGGIAVLGMTIRAIGVGVADGYAEWGDERSFPILMAYASNRLENEQAREAACRALAWVTPAGKEDDVPSKVKALARSTKDQDRFMASCLVEGVAYRLPEKAKGVLVDLIADTTAPALRARIAQVVGLRGLSDGQASKLMTGLKDPTAPTAVDAAVALLLGGKANVAAEAMAAMAAAPIEARSELQERYGLALDRWSREDLAEGRVGRWVDNAMAAASRGGKDAEWILAAVSKALQIQQFDNGPHSNTRAVLIYQLRQQAVSADREKRLQAIRSLQLAQARGALMALADGSPSAFEAQQALQAIGPDALLHFQF